MWGRKKHVFSLYQFTVDQYNESFLSKIGAFFFAKVLFSSHKMERCVLGRALDIRSIFPTLKKCDRSFIQTQKFASTIDQQSLPKRI